MSEMQTRLPPVLCILLAALLVAQFGCGRLSRLGTSGSPTPSPNHTELVDQILDRYQAAIGGLAAIDKVKSYSLHGTFETSVTRVRGTFEAWGKEPEKTLSIIDFGANGKLTKGFDGETHWMQTPVGTFTDDSPKEMAQMERDSDIYRAGKIKSLYGWMKLEGNARLNGRDVYIVEGIPVKGPSEKLFFDKENGLLLRWDMARRVPQRGNVFVKVFLDDFREIDGVKEPFTVRFAFESFDFTIKLDELKHNVQLDDAIFKKPVSK
jgi:zinc protease